jgi:hypothetical protein
VVPEHPGGRAAATWWQAGTAKMEEMEKIVVRMEKIIVRMEKIVVRMEKFLVKVEKYIVYSWQDWSCYLKAVTHGCSSGHKEVALCCLFLSEMRFQSGECCRIVENSLDLRMEKKNGENGENSSENGESGENG